MIILSYETLTILVLVSFSLSSLISLILIIYAILFLRKYFIKRRNRIKPLRSSSILSADCRTPTPHPYKQTNSTSNDRNYFNEQLSIQQKHSSEYLRNDYDETTKVQKANQSFRYQIRPAADMRNFDRNTPYPADILAREQLMYNNRLSTHNKY